ncbi:hypothetical protein GCM10010896_09840 [Mammaliicoccus stepanovicii]|uniref:LcnD-like C-terminal domain-containing protein n=3 Tax=Mammaliicoccus stepanovicii TaxID=643214 RepID=A0A239YI71_9STAP|nr:hypothetical protein GCM10010896_09840 [Mammaliicoccus stepanovicii]SNV57884.1 Uncharacterised protein [Mammaliicoccus stepanovicii]
MRKIYSFEDFQDSTVYLNNVPSKFIRYSLLIIFIVCVAITISLFFIKKTDYIKSTGIIQSKNDPVNITTGNDVKINKILKKNSQFIEKNNRVINTQDMADDKNQMKSKIQYKKDKLDDLSILTEKIDKYPLETNNKLHTDYSFRYLKNYIKLYNEIGYSDNLQRNNIRDQSIQQLNEKMDVLNDEIQELSSVNNNDIHDYATNSGYIFYPEEVQEGLIVTKGNVLYQIFPNKYKEVVTYISGEDILNLKQNQKVSIKFKTKKEEFLISGLVKFISQFPEESKSGENLYKVKVSLKKSIPSKLENIYYLKGVSYIELEKETIAQYLYRKLKE